MTYSDFISATELTENQIGIIEYLDKQFLSNKMVQRKISYKLPFYVGNRRLCYINPKKTGQIELCFINGKPLSKSFCQIKMKNRKWIGGITIDCDQDIDIKYLLEVFGYALFLDRETDI